MATNDEIIKESHKRKAHYLDNDEFDKDILNWMLDEARAEQTNIDQKKWSDKIIKLSKDREAEIRADEREKARKLFAKPLTDEEENIIRADERSKLLKEPQFKSLRAVEFDKGKQQAYKQIFDEFDEKWEFGVYKENKVSLGVKKGQPIQDEGSLHIKFDDYQNIKKKYLGFEDYQKIKKKYLGA